MGASPLYPAVALPLAALFVCSCLGPTAARDSVESVALATVAVARVVPESLSRELVLTGEFRPYQVIELHAKVAGYLKTIYVDIGDHVTASQLLATLEIPEMNDELLEAGAEYRRATAELMRLKGELERAQANLTLVDLSYNRLSSVTQVEPGLVAQQEIDEALARKQAAEAQVAAAKAGLSAAEQQIEVAKANEQKSKTMMEYSRIVAPFAGMITKRYVDTGAMIQAGTASHSQAMPVVRLAQIDRLRMVLPVPESHVSKIRGGASVTIRVNSLGKTFTGTVSRFTGEVQLATRTMDVEVDVPNPGGLLLPGMYADAHLTLERRDQALTVPIQSLGTREGKSYVMVVSQQGVIEERFIQVGIEAAEKVEAVSGLQAGEQVIVGNKSELKSGQRVEPKVMGAS
ncbi:MAG: efflux RND transporter periplasmic adaptor subunit [Acidobacteria bacterium]|nr:efflux RND transporter periplasmic adaptor subunit [Acidobacteriota bacterium]